MIETSEAIRTARALIGTPYSELDCINLIKKVIRTAPGGDKNYTTAGTNELWNSFDSVPKYRHLIWRQTGISGAKPGMLAFMGVGTGDVNHTGLVTERGTVIHSSKSRGCVVETALTEKNGWNGLGAHRMIGVDYSERGKAEVSEVEKIFGNATVNITSGYLNIRDGASTRSKIIAKAENGTRVNVIREAGGTGWVFGKLENGVAGYMSSEYLVEDTVLIVEEGEKGKPATTTLCRDDGVYITLIGAWALAKALIAAEKEGKESGWKYKVVCNDWVKGSHNRTYVSARIYTNAWNRKRDLEIGYIDNMTGALVAA